MVTDNQIPQWLNLTDKKIEVIDHTEIIDAKYLPVFNSSVIEMNIYKIPGLSENFIVSVKNWSILKPHLGLC